MTRPPLTGQEQAAHLQAAMPLEAKTLPIQCNMSRPPLPMQAQVPMRAIGLDTMPTNAQAIPTLPNQRNMTHPPFTGQEQAPAGTDRAIIAPPEAQTPAPKQHNMTRPVAPAPSMNQQAGMSIEAQMAVPSKQQNMS